MKFAIIVIVACLGYASATFLAGGWSSQEKASDKVIEIASWSSKHKDLGLLDIASGPITVTEISNIHTQIVSGINYKFTITVSFNDAQGQQVVCYIMFWIFFKFCVDSFRSCFCFYSLYSSLMCVRCSFLFSRKSNAA